MNAYALAAEDGAITLVVVTPAETFEFSLTDPKVLADTLKRAMRHQEEREIENALLIRPQTEGVQIDGWTV